VRARDTGVPMADIANLLTRRNI